MTSINVSGIELSNKAFDLKKSTMVSINCNNVSITNDNMAYMFRDFKNITSVTNFNDNVTNMYYTFQNSKNLTTVSQLPKNLEYVRYIFDNCTKLSGNIYFPSENIIAAKNSFSGTTNTKNVYIPFNTATYYSFLDAGYKTNTRVNGVLLKQGFSENYVNENGWYYNKISKDIIRHTGSETEVVIPHSINLNTINGISLYTFFKDSNVVNVDLNGFKLRNFDNSFSNCTKLKNVINFSGNGREMEHTFYNCTNLVNAPEIPNSVTTLSMTFYNCSNLINAPEIPNSVTNIYRAFERCNSLTDAPIIPDSVHNMFSSFSRCSNLINIPHLPNNITILNSTFSSCDSLVNAPIIPDSVINLSSTFSQCPSLVNAPIIPDSVINLSDTFSSCTSLVNAPIIPNNVMDMRYCFAGCESLTGNIYIYSNILSSIDNIFDYTTATKNVYIHMFTTEDESFEGYGYSVSSYWGSENPFPIYSDVILNSMTTSPNFYIQEGSSYVKFPYDYFYYSDEQIEIYSGPNFYVLTRNSSDDKQIVIPSGSFTTIYKLFNNQGYSNDTRVNGVQLFDIDSLS